MFMYISNVISSYILYNIFCCFTARWLTLSHLSRKQPHSPDFNHCVFVSFLPEGHRDPRIDAGFLSLIERLVRLELELSNLITTP